MKSDIEGVVIRPLTRFDDHRGWLIELFRDDELDKKFRPAMSYISLTRPGTTRGPHEHARQTDYFCFIGPSNFRLYLWDNRPHSPTYRKKFCLEVGESNKVAILVPPGVVHAYKNIGTTDGIVYNAPDKLYGGQNKKDPIDEIRYEDSGDIRFAITD